MLIPFLFIISLVIHWLICFEVFVSILEDKKYRDFQTLIIFISLMIWFISILIVNKSMLNLLTEL